MGKTRVSGYHRIEFPDECLHKNKKISNLDIGKFSGSRSTDRKKALARLDKKGHKNGVPEGYILHHDMESGKIQVVNEEMHKKFTHHGGHSYYKNKAGGS